MRDYKTNKKGEGEIMMEEDGKISLELNKLITSVATEHYLKSLKAGNLMLVSQKDEINMIIKETRKFLDLLDKQEGKIKSKEYYRILKLKDQNNQNPVNAYVKEALDKRYEMLIEEVFPIRDALKEFEEIALRLRKEGKI